MWESTIFPITGGCSEGLGAFWFFFKQNKRTTSGHEEKKALTQEAGYDLPDLVTRWVALLSDESGNAAGTAPINLRRGQHAVGGEVVERKGSFRAFD